MMLKVVIADDEPIVLEGLRWMIDWEKLGFELVGAANDGEDALKLIGECRPDLVITDIRMPVVDGLALIHQASERYPRTKFIILSGYLDFEYARQAIRYGVSNYLTKPLDDRELHAAVAAAAAAIRSEEAELKSQQNAALHIRQETVTRLLLGDTRQEWVDSARLYLNIGPLTRIRCVQLLSGQEEGPLYADLNLAVTEVADLNSALTEVMVIPFRITPEYQGFLFASPSSGPPLSVEPVERMIAGFRSSFGEEAGFAVSNEHRGPLWLHQAYQESITAGICKLPSKEKGIYFFQDKLLKNPSLIPAELKTSILQAVAGGNPDGVRHFSQAFFAAVTVNQTSESWAGAYLSTVKLEALKVLLEHGADVDEWAKRWFAAAPPQEFGGMKFRWIKELVQAAEWIAEGKGARTDATIHAAVEYIKLHYQDKIQLQQVADHLQLNPAYLGQRFKKQLGVAFNDYLHSVRIEEAKRLLRRTELKIADIAARVGYSDTDQFVAKFKAKTGMPPSAYKKG